MFPCPRCSPDLNATAAIDPRDCPNCRVLIDSMLSRWEQGNISLDELCRDHPGLREEVARRINALESMANWLKQVSQPIPALYDGSTCRPEIPGLEIEEQIGRGGMGVVYKARQTALQRVVALKMILAEGALDSEYRNRFHREAERRW